MYKFTMFNSFRNSISGKWRQNLEDIIEHSKDLELNYNQRQTALGYFIKNIIPKLEKIEEKKDHFTIDQFRDVLLAVPSWAMPREQIERLKIIARGGIVPKPKVEPKEEKEIKIIKTVDEDGFPIEDSREKDLDRYAQNLEADALSAEENENAQRVAASIRARAATLKAKENEELYKMGEDI